MKHHRSLPEHHRLSELLLATAAVFSICLTFSKADNLPVVAAMPSQLTLPRGLPASISCPVTSSLPISSVIWTKDLSPLAISGRLSLGPDWSLHFLPVASSDVGTYACIPANSAGFGSASSLVQVSVKDPPTLRPPLPTYTVPLHGVAILSCSATGVPNPVIVWKKVSGTGELPPAARVVVSNISMTISNVQKEDYGSYVCSATNSIANATSDVTQLYVLNVSPQAPSMLKVSTNVFDANLTWLPGYSGGLLQTFVIRYRQQVSPPTLWWQTVLVGNSNSTATIYGLYADTTYEFAVQGSSLLGEGSLSDVVAKATKGYNSNDVQSLPVDSLGVTYFPPILEKLGPEPAPVSHLSAMAVNSSCISVMWMVPVTVDSSAPVLYYVISVSINGGSWQIVSRQVATAALRFDYVPSRQSSATFNFSVTSYGALSYSDASFVLLTWDASGDAALSAAAAIGIGVTLAALAMLLVIAVACLIRAHRRRTRQREVASTMHIAGIEPAEPSNNSYPWPSHNPDEALEGLQLSNGRGWQDDRSIFLTDCSGEGYQLTPSSRRLLSKARELNNNSHVTMPATFSWQGYGLANNTTFFEQAPNQIGGRQMHVDDSKTTNARTLRSRRASAVGRRDCSGSTPQDADAAWRDGDGSAYALAEPQSDARKGKLWVMHQACGSTTSGNTQSTHHANIRQLPVYNGGVKLNDATCYGSLLSAGNERSARDASTFFDTPPLFATGRALPNRGQPLTNTPLSRAAHNSTIHAASDYVSSGDIGNSTGYSSSGIKAFALEDSFIPLKFFPMPSDMAPVVNTAMSQSSRLPRQSTMRPHGHEECNPLIGATTGGIAPFDTSWLSLIQRHGDKMSTPSLTSGDAPPIVAVQRVPVTTPVSNAGKSYPSFALRREWTKSTRTNSQGNAAEKLRVAYVPPLRDKLVAPAFGCNSQLSASGAHLGKDLRSGAEADRYTRERLGRAIQTVRTKVPWATRHSDSSGYATHTDTTTNATFDWDGNQMSDIHSQCNSNYLDMNHTSSNASSGHGTYGTTKITSRLFHGLPTSNGSLISAPIGCVYGDTYRYAHSENNSFLHHPLSPVTQRVLTSDENYEFDAPQRVQAPRPLVYNPRSQLVPQSMPISPGGTNSSRGSYNTEERRGNISAMPVNNFRFQKLLAEFQEYQGYQRASPTTPHCRLETII